MSESPAPPPLNLQDVQAVVNTTLDMSESSSFLWQIENYSKLFEGDNQSVMLTSPTLTGGPPGNHSWQIALYPKLPKDGNRYLALYVQLKAFGDGNESVGRKLKTYFQFSLLDRNNQRLLWSNGCRSYGKGMSWGFRQFLLSDAVTSTENRFLTDDVLKIHIELIIQGNLIHKVTKENGTKVPIEETLQQRNFQFGKMFKDSIFTDITVKGPTKSFAAHKCVLAAASPVFAAMLTTQIVEESGTVFIQDYDDEVTKSMLEYIYQGEISLTDVDKISQLILIANEYELGPLKADCEILLKKHLKLTPNTAPETLIIADSSNASNLKNFVVAYIKRNFDTVKQTKEFMDLINSSRSGLIYDTL